VVEQVWTEITQHAPQALVDSRLEREPEVEIDPALQAKFSLQLGETAAIAFALKHAASLLLTDDAAARRACASVGLAAVGTIGLILEAARSKRVPVDEALQALEVATPDCTQSRGLPGTQHRGIRCPSVPACVTVGIDAVS
jgi:predicted nucleic acid-binding protein